MSEEKGTVLHRQSSVEQLVEHLKTRRDASSGRDLWLLNNIISALGKSHERNFHNVGDFLDYPAEASGAIFGAIFPGSPKPYKNPAGQMFYACLAEMGLEVTKTRLSPASGYDDIMKALNQAAYQRPPEEPSAPFTRLLRALRWNGKLPEGFSTVGDLLANRDKGKRRLGEIPNIGAKGPSMTILYKLLDSSQSLGKGA